MHIAVCDDNVADRKQMERLLQRSSDRRIQTTGVFYIDSYGNVEAVMRSPMLYDAFFIDMTSGSVNGFQLARKLIDAGVTAPIVLCISTIDYPAIIEAAITEVPSDGIENSNHDILRRQLKTQIRFLHKQIKTDELEEMLDYCLQIKASTIPTIELRGEKDTLYVYEDEIMYAEKEGNYSHVTLTESRSIDILGSITNLYSQIAGFEHFILISEQVFVNISFVAKLSLLKLVMNNQHRFTVSPFILPTLKKALEDYQSAL
ncbi:MAG: hypothetical protein LUI12_05420 [Clostridiales bacterium]|nr:hypothetical protein [Clostridiales bacterium]